MIYLSVVYFAGCFLHYIGFNNICLLRRTVTKFVLGSQSCHIHPDDRISQYSCQEWIPNISLGFKLQFSKCNLYAINIFCIIFLCIIKR